MAIVGLKVPATVPLAKCVASLRSLVPFSISSLKTNVLNGEYVYTCNYIDTEGIGTAIRLYEALSQRGIHVLCYEHDRPCSIEFLNNLYKAQVETMQEIEDEDNRL